MMATREPLPRAWHAAVGIGSKLHVWGGYNSDSAIQAKELESFDILSVTWQDPQVLHGVNMPDGLRAMAVTSDGETSYSFGGATGSASPFTYYNDLFQVTPSQHFYHNLQPTSSSESDTAPQKKADSRAVQYGDKLVLHGGNTSQKCTNELHVFDLKKSECGPWC